MKRTNVERATTALIELITIKARAEDYRAHAAEYAPMLIREAEEKVGEAERTFLAFGSVDRHLARERVRGLAAFSGDVKV